MAGYEIDWSIAAAWVQAVGSVAAILVAIAVDRGSGRRAIAAALAVRAALIHDARDALILARDVVRNFTELVGGLQSPEKLPDFQPWLRRIAAARGTVDHYLAMDVPDAKLVASLSSASMILKPAADAYEGSASNIPMHRPANPADIYSLAVQTARDLDAVVEEYDSGAI